MLEHPGVLKDPVRVRGNWQAAYGGAALFVVNVRKQKVSETDKF